MQSHLLSNQDRDLKYHMGDINLNSTCLTVPSVRQLGDWLERQKSKKQATNNLSRVNVTKVLCYNVDEL